MCGKGVAASCLIVRSDVQDYSSYKNNVRYEIAADGTFTIPEKVEPAANEKQEVDRSMSMPVDRTGDGEAGGDFGPRNWSGTGSRDYGMGRPPREPRPDYRESTGIPSLDARRGSYAYVHWCRERQGRAGQGVAWRACILYVAQ
jgi:hypothetical protein